MALATFDRINHFGDAAAEAKACRADCALFDFSFLECAQLKGGGAAEAIEAFTGRSLAALAVGKICYALRVAPSGALVADLTVWRTGADTYEVMSGRHDEVADLLDDAGPDVVVTDVTSHNATFALQGPGTLDALNRLGDARSIKALGYFSFGLVKLKESHAGSGASAIPEKRDLKLLFRAGKRAIFGTHSRSMLDQPALLPLTCSVLRLAWYYSATTSVFLFRRRKPV